MTEVASSRHHQRLDQIYSEMRQRTKEGFITAMEKDSKGKKTAKVWALAHIINKAD